MDSSLFLLPCFLIHLFACLFFFVSFVILDGNFLKELSVLGRSLSQVVIIDNSPHAFGYQVSNRQ